MRICRVARKRTRAQTIRLWLALAAVIGTNCEITGADAQSVAFSNTVGFRRVQTPPGGVAFLSPAFVTGSNSLDQVIGIQAEPLQDSIRTWDGDAYHKYLLFPPLDDPRSNTWVSAQTFQSADLLLGPGSAMIYENTQASNRVLTLVGDVAMDDFATRTIPNGIHMVSYPFSSDIALNDTTLASASRSGNKIHTFDPQTQEYHKFIYLGEIPGDDLRSSTWLDATTFLPAEYVLDVGEGFFFENTDPDPVVWTEARPY